MIGESENVGTITLQTNHMSLVGGGQAKYREKGAIWLTRAPKILTYPIKRH